MKDCAGDELLFENIANSSKQTIMMMVSILRYAVVLAWLFGSYAHRMIGV